MASGPVVSAMSTGTEELAGPDMDDPIPVVIITTFDRDEYVYGALKAGARGLLLKDTGQELLSYRP